MLKASDLYSEEVAGSLRELLATVSPSWL